MTVHAPIRLDAPRAYTGPYPIHDHRSQADLQADQDEFDAEHARHQVHVYRIAQRGSQPVDDAPGLPPRIWLGMINGAAITGGAIFLIALLVRAFGG